MVQTRKKDEVLGDLLKAEVMADEVLVVFTE